jgi:hypothetical protein
LTSGTGADSGAGETGAATAAATGATSAGIAFTKGLAGGGVSLTGTVSGTGETGAATGTATSFAGFTGAAAGLTNAPQVSQNFTSGASAEPHCGQAGKASIFAPQDSQNFIPGITGLPHFWQVF